MPYHFATSTFSFTVNVDRKMLPSCRMVVYYIRNEEVVADETELKVINEFENQVSVMIIIYIVHLCYILTPNRPVRLPR